MSVRGRDVITRLVEILNIMKSQYPHLWDLGDSEENAHHLTLNGNLAICIEELLDESEEMFVRVSVSHWDIDVEIPFPLTREAPGPQILGVVLYQCIGPANHDSIMVKMYSNGRFVADGRLVENPNSVQKNFVCEVDEETLIELIHMFSNIDC